MGQGKKALGGAVAGALAILFFVLAAGPGLAALDTSKFDLPPPRAGLDPEETLPGPDQLPEWRLERTESNTSFPAYAARPQSGVRGYFRESAAEKITSGLQITVWKFASDQAAMAAWDKLMPTIKVKPENREAVSYGPWPGTEYKENLRGLLARRASVRFGPFIASAWLYTKTTNQPPKAQMQGVILALWRQMAGAPPPEGSKPPGPPPILSLLPDRRYLPGWSRSSARKQDHEGTVGIPAQECVTAIFNPLGDNTSLAGFMSLNICRYEDAGQASEYLDRMKALQINRVKIRGIQDTAINGNKAYFYENFSHRVGYTATANAVWREYYVEVSLFSKSFQPRKEEAARLAGAVLLKVSGQPPPGGAVEPDPEPRPAEPEPAPRPGPEPKPQLGTGFSLTPLLPGRGELPGWKLAREEQGYQAGAFGGVLPWNQVVLVYEPYQGPDPARNTLQVLLMDFNTRAQAARYWISKMADLAGTEKNLQRITLDGSTFWLALSAGSTLAKAWFLHGWYLGQVGLRSRDQKIDARTMRPILEQTLAKLKKRSPPQGMGPGPRLGLELGQAQIKVREGEQVPLQVTAVNTTAQPLKEIAVRVWTSQDSKIRLARERNQIGFCSLDFKLDSLAPRARQTLPILVEGTAPQGRGVLKLATVPDTGVRTVTVELEPRAGASVQGSIGGGPDPAAEAFQGRAGTLEIIKADGAKAALQGRLEDLSGEVVLVEPTDSGWAEVKEQWASLKSRENRAVADLLGQVEGEAGSRLTSGTGQALEVADFFGKLYRGVAYLLAPERTEEEILRAVGAAFMPPDAAELAYLAEYRQYRLERLRLEADLAAKWPPLEPATVGFSHTKEVIRGLLGKMPDGRTYLLGLGSGSVGEMW